MFEKLNETSASHIYSEVDQGDIVYQIPLDDAASQDEDDSVIDVSLRTDSRWQRSLTVAVLFMIAIGVIAIGLQLAPSFGVHVGSTEELSLIAYRNRPEIKEESAQTCHSFRCHPQHQPDLTEPIAEYRPFLKDQSWLIRCPSSGCSHALCCDSSCFNYTCPWSRPYPYQNEYLRNCKSGGCNDMFCCHARPETCMDKPCREHYRPRANRWEIECPPTRCSHDRCCKLIPLTCANMTCPKGFTHVHGHQNILCNASSALACPTSACCEKEETVRNCSSFQCPHHYAPDARDWKITCNGDKCNTQTCCHTLYPPWARLGLRVVSISGVGNITSIDPVDIKIAWRNGTITDPVKNWSGIAMAPPPWARKGMQVQDTSLRTGRISALRPFWKITYSDGTIVDSATNWSASFWGLVQLPPAWASKGVAVAGPFGKTGQIIDMPRAKIEWSDGKVFSFVPNWDGIVQLPPPWAAKGVNVTFRDGTTGSITAMQPLPAIHRDKGPAMSPVHDWYDIIQTPPSWARKDMKVQAESLRIGRISVLRPLWAIEWLDGSKTDSATNESASWDGIVQLPPSWVAVGTIVVGPRGKKGMVASMPRASIDWEDGNQQFPVNSWEGISRGTGFATVPNRPPKISSTNTRIPSLRSTDEAVDVRTAFSLVIAIIFVMLLFTLVNFEADDVRRNTWNIFAGVTSVFTAYLLFSIVNRLVQNFAKGFGDVAMCSVQYCIFFGWVAFGLLVSGVISGALGEGADHPLNEEVWVKADYLRSDYGYPIFNSMHVRHCEGVRSICIIQGVEVPVEKKKRNLEVRQQHLKCWGMLFSDVAGFAAISAGGSLQHLEMFADNPIVALAPVLFSQCLISAIYTCFSSNGKPDWLKDLRKRMFVEEVSASEVDVSALTCSFLLVQVLRFKLTGKLPSLNGNLEQAVNEPYILLYSCGLVLGIISLILIILKSVIVAPREEPLSGCARFLNIASASLGLSFAWCIVFATSALLQSYAFSENGIGTKQIFGHCMLALTLSIACMLGIWVNRVAERFCQRVMKYRPYSAEVLLRIITAESLFVGYTWVSAFSESIGVVCSLAPNALLCEVLLVVFALLVIMPAWQKYIVPKTMLLQAYHLRKLAGAAHGRPAAMLA